MAMVAAVAVVLGGVRLRRRQIEHQKLAASYDVMETILRGLPAHLHNRMPYDVLQSRFRWDPLEIEPRHALARDV
jgi:hypothetical protein